MLSDGLSAVNDYRIGCRAILRECRNLQFLDYVWVYCKILGFFDKYKFVGG